MEKIVRRLKVQNIDNIFDTDGSNDTVTLHYEKWKRFFQKNFKLMCSFDLTWGLRFLFVLNCINWICFYFITFIVFIFYKYFMVFLVFYVFAVAIQFMNLLLFRILFLKKTKFECFRVCLKICFILYLTRFKISARENLGNNQKFGKYLKILPSTVAEIKKKQKQKLEMISEFF